MITQGRTIVSTNLSWRQHLMVGFTLAFLAILIVRGAFWWLQTTSDKIHNDHITMLAQSIEHKADKPAPVDKAYYITYNNFCGGKYDGNRYDDHVLSLIRFKDGSHAFWVIKAGSQSTEEKNKAYKVWSFSVDSLKTERNIHKALNSMLVKTNACSQRRIDTDELKKFGRDMRKEGLGDKINLIGMPKVK